MVYTLLFTRIDFNLATTLGHMVIFISQMRKTIRSDNRHEVGKSKHKLELMRVDGNQTPTFSI